MRNVFIYSFFVFIILMSCTKEKINDSIFEKFEKNHYIQNKVFYYSSIFLSMNIHVYNYENADAEIFTSSGEKIFIKIIGDSITIIPQYYNYDYLKYLPQIVIGDINTLKKFDFKYSKKYFRIYDHEGNSITMKEIKQYDEDFFFSKIIIKPSNSFFSFSISLDSVK